MKPLLLITIFTIVTHTIFAQTDSNKAATELIDVVAWCDEVQPQYPGGGRAIQKFFAHNVKYPAQALKYGASGIVVVEFEIDTLGNTFNFSIVKSVCHELDQEALRVVKLLKGWSPYMLHGKKQTAYLRQPVVYNMEATSRR